MTMTAKQTKTQTLTKPMKVWMLKTLKTGTISMETANEFFQMCEKLELIKRVTINFVDYGNNESKTTD